MHTSIKIGAIEMYSQELLDEKLDEVTKIQTEEEFVNKSLGNISKILKLDPQRYRYYGVFWWRLKILLIDSQEWIDDHVDTEWKENFDFGNDAKNIIAAWMYSEERMDNGEMPSNHGIIDIDGENQEYTLYDDFMERLADVK